MVEPYIGQINIFAGIFAPRGWAFCEGQILEIAEHSVLSTILGKTYGGNGTTNFALPDLRCRVPVGAGDVSEIRTIAQGEKVGEDVKMLSARELPEHSHDSIFKGTGGSTDPLSAEVTINAKNGNGDQDNPENGYWAVGTVKKEFDINNVVSSYSSDYDKTMNPNAVNVKITGGEGITGGSVDISKTGSGLPFDNRQPSLGVRYVIALEGTYPPRG